MHMTSHVNIRELYYNNGKNWSSQWMFLFNRHDLFSIIVNDSNDIKQYPEFYSKLIPTVYFSIFAEYCDSFKEKIQTQKSSEIIKNIANVAIESIFNNMAIVNINENIPCYNTYNKCQIDKYYVEYADTEYTKKYNKLKMLSIPSSDKYAYQFIVVMGIALSNTFGVENE